MEHTTNEGSTLQESATLSTVLAEETESPVDGQEEAMTKETNTSTKSQKEFLPAAPASSEPSTPDSSPSPQTGGKDWLLSYPLTDNRRLQRVSGWGMAHAADCYSIRPSTIQQVETIFSQARELQHRVTLRGSAQSYGDAHIGQNAILLDCTRMNRILDWDPTTGIIDIEPGVRIADLWRYTLEDGWWPPVVSGTMQPTIAGAAAMNIHGKNNFKAGTIGEYILSFELLTPRGERLECSPTQNKDVFYAAIGGFGMLGYFTRFRMQMKRIYSGDVEVTAVSTKSIQEMMDYFEANLTMDYLVGWVDCTSRNKGLGRGLIHAARHLPPGEDLDPLSSLRVSRQELPDTLFGFIPKSTMWLGMWFARPFWKWVNTLKYYMGQREAKAPPYLQSHASFNFLLDYVPNWKFGYKPHGLIQYQSFVPKKLAREVFEEQLKLSQKAGMTPYLGVMKKHKPDPFLLTHAVDGYSFALDYAVKPRNRNRLQGLIRAMTQLVLDAGGRFYFAKDGMLQPHEIRQAWPDEAFSTFRDLKQKHDPDMLLESDLSRRIGIFEDDFMTQNHNTNSEHTP